MAYICAYSTGAMPKDQPSNTQKLNQASARERKIAGLIFSSWAALLGLLALCRIAGFDISRLFLPCGFQQRHHLPCPTCGWTTALKAFSQGHLIRAFYIQPAASLTCLGLVVLALIALYIALSGAYPVFVGRLYRELKLKHVLGSFVIIVLAGWAVTFIRALMRLESW
jgi:hypothetical protein